MKHHDPEDNDEPRMKRYRRCPDRMCGALDCPNCHPHNFRCGVYTGDFEEDEAMNILQEANVVSDNAVHLADIANADIDAANKCLQEQRDRK